MQDEYKMESLMSHNRLRIYVKILAAGLEGQQAVPSNIVQAFVILGTVILMTFWHSFTSYAIAKCETCPFFLWTICDRTLH